MASSGGSCRNEIGKKTGNKRSLVFKANNVFIVRRRSDNPNHGSAQASAPLFGQAGLESSLRGQHRHSGLHFADDKDRRVILKCFFESAIAYVLDSLAGHAP